MRCWCLFHRDSFTMTSFVVALQVRSTDVEMLAGSPEGQPLASAARQWAAFDGSTGALHRLANSDDYVSVQLHGACPASATAAAMLVSRCKHSTVGGGQGYLPPA